MVVWVGKWMDRCVVGGQKDGEMVKRECDE